MLSIVSVLSFFIAVLRPKKKLEEEEEKKEKEGRNTHVHIPILIFFPKDLTFEYLGMCVAASIVCCVGLVTGSGPTVVSSMLLSPLMGR